MADGILSLKDKTDGLVNVVGDVAVLVAPYGATVPTKLSTGAGGELTALPAGFVSVGEIAQKDGVKITPDTKTQEILGYGSLAPRRIVKTGESVELQLSPQEARNINFAMFWGTNPEDTVVDPVTGEYQILKSANAGKIQYYSVILVGQDENEFGFVHPYWIFPKMSVTKSDSFSLQMDQEVTYPITLTAFEDKAYGGYVAVGACGAGSAAMNADAGFVTSS